jgi:multiple sugar transport system permease protein
MANLPVAPARLDSYYAGPDHQGAIMAGGLLASLPTTVFFLFFLFFLFFQRYFVRGIALSGLRG